MLQPITANRILDLWARKPLDFDPGSKWQYSNTNYDNARDHVVGVAVLPFASRIKIQRLARPQVQYSVRRDRLQHERWHIILRPIILIARSMRKQLPDGDFVGAGQVGDEFRDLVVERELALLLKQQDRRGGELLAD